MARRVGPQMRHLCRILWRMGGESDSQAGAYMRLRFGREGSGGPSNRFGHAVLMRCARAGLVEIGPLEGGRRKVTLTDDGWGVVREAVNA